MLEFTAAAHEGTKANPLTQHWNDRKGRNLNRYGTPPARRTENLQSSMHLPLVEARSGLA